MHPIAERILSGENVCLGEIRTFNARQIIAQDDRRLEEGPHTPETCNSPKPKDCTHNIGSDRFYADVLFEKAREECEDWCGKHRDKIN